MQVESIPQGEENRNFHIITPDRRYVLRIYNASHSTTGPRSPAEIEFELDFVEHVRASGLPTPAVIPALDGRRVVEIQHQGVTLQAALFEHVPGSTGAAYTPAVARSVAELLLHMRSVSTSFSRSSMRAWPGDIASVSLHAYRQNRHLLIRHQEELDQLHQRTRVEYAAVLKMGLPSGMIHGDIKLDNVIFSGDQVQAVLDFDEYHSSFLIDEWTRTALHDLDSATRNAIRSGQYPVFQSAFERHPSVTENEKRALPVFFRARFLYDVAMYAVMDLHDLIDDLFDDPQVLRWILDP